MSAECSKCGTDIVYPAGTWPIGECPVCTRWDRDDVKRFVAWMFSVGGAAGFILGTIFGVWFW